LLSTSRVTKSLGSQANT